MESTYSTIDNLDISVYNMYAIRSRMVEQIQREFHLEDAAAVSSQLQMITTQAQLLEMDQLFGLLSPVTSSLPWAYFFPPNFYFAQRFSPFTFAQIAPSLKQEGKEEDEDELADTHCTTDEEKEEKNAILGCLKTIRKLNGWLGFVRGRVGQFLQG